MDIMESYPKWYDNHVRNGMKLPFPATWPDQCPYCLRLMTEQEYKDKLAVREHLSQFDRLRLLEHEFNLLISIIPADELTRSGIIRNSEE